MPVGLPFCQELGCTARAANHYVVVREKRGVTGDFTMHDHLDLCNEHGEKIRSSASNVREFPLGSCPLPCPRLRARDHFGD